MFHRYLLPAFLAMFLGSLVQAQNVKFSANAKEITTDDVFQLFVDVSGGGRMRSPNFPAISGFRQSGTSTSQSFGSGGAKATFSVTYIPTKTGTFTVPSFKYEVGGKAYFSPPFKVRVKKGTGKRQNNSRNGADPFADFFKSPFDDFFQKPGTQPKPEEFKETRADYFLTLNLSKDTAYVGEQVFSEIALYVNAPDRNKVGVDGQAIADLQQRIKNQGFWQETIELDRIPQEVVSVNGKPYIKYTFYRSVLFPIKSGKINFKEVYLDAKKLYVATTNSPFDAFFGRNTKFEPIKITAADRSIYIKPLPKTDLENAGMVGRFKMKAELSGKQLNTGEILEMKVEIKGNGNIAMMQEPSFNMGKTWEVDPPSSNYNVMNTESALYGEKTFTWSMVPTKAGDYDLGPIKFYYFDADREAYDSLEVPSLPVRVTGEDLSNLLLKTSGMDGFYRSNIDAADDSIMSKPFSGKWAILGLLLVVLASVGYGTYKYSRQAKLTEEEEIDATQDYFS